jgi:hypothetical protein
MTRNLQVTPRRSAVAAAAALLALLSTQLIAIQAPLGDAKFVAYGGPEFDVDAELGGQVVKIHEDRNVFFLALSRNYHHFAIEGNRRRPTATEDYPDAYWNGYRAIEDVIGASHVPIVKLESYGVGERIGTEGPLVVKEDGVERPLRVGDFIRVTGLYAIDYSHTMYYHLHTSSAVYMRGFYKTGYAHTELHPFNHSTIELQTPQNANSEVHVVSAPVYPEVYSKTYLWNKWMGVAGHFVDASKQSTRTATFFIPAPRRPSTAKDLQLRLVRSELVERGAGTAYWSSVAVPGGFNVTVSITGHDVMNPKVHKARYTARWIAPGGSDSQWVSQSVPWIMPAGERAAALMQMRNVGPDPWEPGHVWLAAAKSGSVWGSHVGHLQQTVLPGGTGVFALTLDVPSTPGAYPGSWQLHRDGIPFGVASPVLSIHVQPPQIAGFFPGFYHKLVARNSAKVLDVAGAGCSDGDPVIQWTDVGAPNQRWMLLRTGDDWYVVAQHSWRVLDVTGGPAALHNGAPLQQWQGLGPASTNQKWRPTPTGDGFHVLTAVHSGKAADVSGGPTAIADGVRIQQWDYYGSSNQQWLLEPTRAFIGSRSRTCR